jgi:phosphatidylglycerophosphate synthase
VTEPPGDRPDRPTLAELRAVTQPASTMDRRNAEHWLARLWLRDVSLRATAVLIRTPVTANQLTGLMIVVGLAAAVVASRPGLVPAVVAAALVVGYFLLDLCDGEVARWRSSTSVTGVYLDRVGHYLVEAALLTAYGFRAAGGVPPAGNLGGWTTLGVATALLAVLIKAETDLVDVARVRSGLDQQEEAAAELRSPVLGAARRVASLLRVHQLTGALESSLLLVVAAVVDQATGSLAGTRVLVILLAVVSAVMVVLHLASILLSRRLS